MKPFNRVDLISPDIIREGDRVNYFLVRLTNSDGSPVDVSNSNVTWSMANKQGRVIADKTAEKTSDLGVIKLGFGVGDQTGYGKFEVQIEVENGGVSEFYPSDNSLEVFVPKNINNLEHTPVAYMTVNDFQNSVSATLANSEEAKLTAGQAKQKAESTQTQLDQIVIDGDSSVEAAQARIRDDGKETKTFATLKDRNDATDEKIAYFINVKEYESSKVLITDGYDWTASVQQAVNDAIDNSVIIFPPEETYYLNKVSSEGKSLSFISYGAKIVQNSNDLVFSLRGGWETPYSISFVTEVSYNFSGEGSVITDKLSISSTSSFEKGDVVKVVSDDEIEGAKQSSTGTRRRGEFAVIGAISGSDLVLTTKLRESYPTNPRVVKLKDVSYKIEGFQFDTLSSGDSNGWNGSFISVRAARDVRINDLQCEKGYGSFLTLTGVYGYSVSDTRIKSLKNDPSTASYGYGINDISSEYGTVDSTIFVDCRHGYTTNTNGLDAGSTTFESYGRSANTTVKGFAHGCSNSAFDTHDEAYNIHFMGCTVYGNYKGKTASGAAFSARGRKVQFTDCVASNCRYGFNVFEGFPNSTKDVFITNCKAFNILGSPVYVNKTGSGNSVKNVFIKGGYFELNRGTLLFDLSDSNGWVDGVEIKVKTNSAYAKIFNLSNANFSVRNVRCDLTEYSLDGSRLFRLNSSSSVKAENITVDYSGGSSHYVAEGDGTGVCIVKNFNGSKEVLPDKDLTSFKFSSGNEFNNTYYFISQTLSANVNLTNKVGQSNHQNIYLKATPSVDAIGFNEFPPGNIRGQMLTIKNDSSSNTLVIRSNSSYRTELRKSQPVILDSKDTVSLLWNGSNWVSM